MLIHVDKQSPEALLMAFQDTGDQAALEQLIYRFNPKVMKIVLAMVSPSNADDVSARVWERVAANAGTFTRRSSQDESRSFDFWLSKIARNTARNWNRDTQRRDHAVELFSDLQDEIPNYFGVSVEDLEDVSFEDLLQDDRTPPPDEVAELKEECAIMAEAVRRLSDEDRQIVDLLFYQGKSQYDAAEEIGVPRTTLQERYNAIINEKLPELFNESRLDKEIDPYPLE